MAYNVGDWVVSDVYFDFDSNLPYGGVHQILGLTNVDGDLVYTLKDTRGVIRYAMEFLFRKQTTEDFFKETDEEKELAEYKRYAKITKERAMGQKYKVGDLVKVRDDIKVGKLYCMENGDKDRFVDEMSPWIGQLVTIESASDSHYNIVGSYWSFTDEMFEGLAKPTVEAPTSPSEGVPEVDMVNHPPHYQNGGIETLDVIRMSMSRKQFKGYLKGQIMKYRERAQFKGNPEQDYAKAKFYYDVLQELKAEKKSKKRGEK